ncbi:hypothetical protein N9807_01465 [Candidatus Pelagibacter sp.]|nr:hypothetical protein [Candidatus Pelagibacter sp.]
MQKKTFIFILLIFLSSCGYEAIHSKKNISNYNFSISKLNFDGDREVNLRMKAKLNNYTLVKRDKEFILNISSTSEKIITAKDASGNATGYKNIITVSINFLNDLKFKNNFVIVENFNYNNNSNSFDLKRYEREIKNNLSEIATDKLIFKLSNMQ